jgi:enoyl-CoA hydratase
MVETFHTLTIERSGHIAEITLCRPEVLNRIDDIGHRELLSACARIAEMEDVRVVVFAAQGKVFSAGGDFDHMLECNADLQTRMETIELGRRLLAAWLEIRPPVVVALHGHAVGLGATIALACDAVVAHPGCQISDPHVNIGLVAGDGGCLLWPQSVGMARAKRHLLTGDALTGDQAYQVGLVSDLVGNAEEVLPAARALAEKLSALPPLAVQGTKRALNAVLRARFDEVVPLSLSHELTTLGSEDLREGVAALRAKRKATYLAR